MKHKLMLCFFMSISITQSISAIEKEQEKKPCIVIFTQGTLALAPHFSSPALSIRTLLTIGRQKFKDSLYKKSVDTIRDNPYFFRNQAMQEKGLQKINLDSLKENTPGLFAHLYDKIQSQSLAKQTNTQYYTFGWSGLLSAEERYNSGKELYTQLKALLKDFERKKIFPRIKILAYSHGGNVALNLARATKEHNDTDLIVDELILLGTPIQRETARYIMSDTFKKIYNLYSRQDSVQKNALDQFPHARTFSRRSFRNRRSYKVTPKVTQVEIKISAPLYTPLDSNQKPTGRIVRRSPGHIELWFFGWLAENTFMYRKSFPLYPLPMAIFVPKIIDTLTTYNIMEQNTPNHLVMELMPYEGQIELRKRHHGKVTRLPFCPPNEIEELKACAKKYWPENFTYELYRAHMNNAVRSQLDKYTKQGNRRSRHVIAQEQIRKS